MDKAFKNKETGEVLTYARARQQFREEYDGDDPTNLITFEELYEEVN